MAKAKYASEFGVGSVVDTGGVLGTAISASGDHGTVVIEPVVASSATTIAGKTASTVTITLPLGDPGSGYLSKHVEARLDQSQAEAMRKALRGLREANLELRNGKPIVSGADVIRWVLEQVTEQAAEVTA